MKTRSMDQVLHVCNRMNVLQCAVLMNWLMNSLPEPHIHVQQNSTYPDVCYPDRLGPSDKFVQNATKLPCLETTGYRIKYSAVLWLLELRIRRGGTM